MQTTFHPLFRSGGVLVATGLALVSVQLIAADKTDAFPTFDSYIKISGLAPSITGDGAAFQARTNQVSDGGAGIEDLHIAKELSNDVNLTIDGRAMTQTEDYLLGLKFEKNELGSFDVGYKRFRTFYDGVGGFFPITKSFMTLNRQDLHIDRGEFWAEAKFARPDAPEFTIKYTNGTRKGQKDSIAWGDSDNSGLTYRVLSDPGLGSNSNATVRKNTPSYFDVDERHETLEGSVKHTIGKTMVQVSVIGDKAKKDNTHFVSRFPGEISGVLPGSTVIVAPVAGVSPASDWQKFNNQTDQTTFDIQDTKTNSAMLVTRTELTPKLTLKIDGSYQDVTGTFSGDRMIVTNAPIAGNVTRTLTSYNVSNLKGETDVKVSTGVIGLDFKATKDFTANFAIRGEDRSLDGSGVYDVISASTALIPVYTTSSRAESSVVDEKTLTPVAELRYTGVKNVAFYMTASNKSGSGTDVQTPQYNPATTTTVSVIYRDIDENNYDYTVGANWKPMPLLNLRGEVFYKDHSFQTTGWNTNTNAPTAPTFDNNYQLDYKFSGVKLSAVVKPLDVLSITTRYVYQKGERQVTGYLPSYPAYDSMESRSHDIGVTVDWNPNPQFYGQVNLDVAFNEIGTASLHDLSSAASGVIPANRFIQNTTNDYTTGSIVFGTVLSKTDDLQVRVTYYKASNYNPLLALYTQPYGASAKESSLTVGVKHKFSDRCLGNVKVGYIDSKNDTTGGNTNFRGPLAYVSLDYAL